MVTSRCPHGFVFVLAVALAACSGTSSATPASPPSTSSAPASSKPASQVSVKPSAAAASAKPSAAASAAPAARPPIKIGVIEPLTGPQANIGKDNQDGFSLYLSSINSTVAGRKIEAIFADDRFQAEVGLTKAKELVESQKVNAIMGITPTPGAYAIAPYIRDAKVPTLITGNAGGLGMTTNPKFKSPYLARFTQTGTEINDPAADWTIKQGFRKAVLISSDFAPGIQNTDYFASIFVDRGGTVLQEMHPALGTTDFGPFLAKMDKTADVIYEFLTGVDGLRFLEQYRDYAGQSKAQLLDAFGSGAAGPNLAQLKDKAIGVVGVDIFSVGSEDPGVQSFLKAWRTAYPDRLLSHDAPMGYAGAQILEAALKKVNGDIEDTQKFMDAVYQTNLDTAKGPIKLDQNHDVVQSIYVYRIVKQGSSFGHQVLQTYKDVSDSWDRTPEQVEKFPGGQLKDKWPGMTKEALRSIAGCASGCSHAT